MANNEINMLGEKLDYIIDQNRCLELNKDFVEVSLSLYFSSSHCVYECLHAYLSCISLYFIAAVGCRDRERHTKHTNTLQYYIFFSDFVMYSIV